MTGEEKGMMREAIGMRRSLMLGGKEQVYIPVQ
jgi:hypothetical protein